MKAIVGINRPPSPCFVLRGHPSEVQCLYFFSYDSTEAHSSREFLISGDSSGYCIVWCLETFRPIAIWKAHASALLTVLVKDDSIITHGRDNKLYMWRIIDYGAMDYHLPIELTSETEKMGRKKPLMIASLDVNSLNFCQFSMDTVELTKEITAQETIIATPGLIGSEYIDVWCLPSCVRLATKIIPPPPKSATGTEKVGNVMSIDIHYPYMVAGYENGSVTLYHLDFSQVRPDLRGKVMGSWKILRIWKQHVDAVLGVKMNVIKQEIYSSSIDSKIVKYSIPFNAEQSEPINDNDKISHVAEEVEGSIKVVNTKHSGQQALVLLAPKGKVCATAGWDGCGRIYSTKTLRCIAILKWHKSQAMAIAFGSRHGTDGKQVIGIAGKDSKISLWAETIIK